MNAFIILSLVSCALSIMASVWSIIAVRRSTDFSKEGLSFLHLNDMREKVNRFSAIEEATVRSVMEEGGLASAEAVLRTTQRLVDMGINPAVAVTEAKKIHKT